MGIRTHSKLVKLRTIILPWLGANWMAVLAFLVSIAALVCSIHSCKSSTRSNEIAEEALGISKDTAHLNAEPMIRGYVRGTIPNDELVLLNDSPLPAVNVSISRLHHYVKLGQVEGSAISVGIRPYHDADYDPEGELIKYLPILNPKQSLTLPLCAGGCITTPTTSVEVVSIDLQYYRESDLKKFHKTLLFFQFEQKVFAFDEFKTHPKYELAMRNFARHLEQVDRLGSIDMLRKSAKRRSKERPSGKPNEFRYEIVVPLPQKGDIIWFPQGRSIEPKEVP